MYTFTRLTCRWCVGVSRYREAPKGMAVITELRFVHVGYRFARSIVSNKTYIRAKVSTNQIHSFRFCESDFAISDLWCRWSNGLQRRTLMENRGVPPRFASARDPHHSSSLKPWRNSIAKPCRRSASFRVHIPFRPCPFSPLKASRCFAAERKVDRNDESDAIKFDPLQSFLRRPVIRYLAGEREGMKVKPPS